MGQDGVQDVVLKKLQKRGSFDIYLVTMDGARVLDRKALEADLHKDRWVRLLSLRRPSDGPAVDLRHSARVLRHLKKVPFGSEDAQFLIRHDQKVRRRVRLLELMGHLRAYYDNAGGQQATLAGSQELVELLPVIEAQLELYRAIGLLLEGEKPDPAGLPERAVAAATELGGDSGKRSRRRKLSNAETRRVWALKNRLPNKRAIAHQEQVTLALYRSVLDRVTAHTNKVLEKAGRGRDQEPAVRKFKALRTTAQALRSLAR